MHGCQRKKPYKEVGEEDKPTATATIPYVRGTGSHQENVGKSECELCEG